MIDRDGYRVVFARRSVTAFWAAMPAIASACALALAFPSSQYEPPLAAQAIAATVAVTLACMAVRVALMRVVVEADVVTVRNAFTSRRVERARLVAVIMPNRSALEARPALRLADDTEVRLDALMRWKNRMWGADRGMTDLIGALGLTLGLPVVDSGLTFTAG